MISGQGTQFSWGTVSLSLTSLSVSSSGDETEITSMSSTVRTDAENTGRRYVIRDYDSGFAAETEVSVEFVADTVINTHDVTEWVGLSRPLSVTLPEDGLGRGVGLRVSSAAAVLTQISINVGVGDYVRGSATFRLSGQ